jgi:hypothetical protein
MSLLMPMSLTLRDAQHLCWKTLRVINDKISLEKGKKWSPLVVVDDIAKNSKKTAKLVKDAQIAKSPLDEKEKEVLATNLSDLLYAPFVLAEHFGLDLEEAFLQTMNDRMILNIH